MSEYLTAEAAPRSYNLYSFFRKCRSHACVGEAFASAAATFSPLTDLQ